MTIKSESISNLYMPEGDSDKIENIEIAVKNKDSEFKVEIENNPNFFKIELTETEKESITEWLKIANDALEELGCKDLIGNIPNLEEIGFYRIKPDVNTDNVHEITGLVPDIGTSLLFLLDREAEIDTEETRKLFLHEIAHIIYERVVSIDSKSIPQPKYLGFDTVSSSIKTDNESIDSMERLTKSSFTEPLADLFSYYCSDKIGKYEHFLPGLYFREDAFLLGLLNNLARMNNDTIKDEFASLFNAFNHRDYSWYKHLVTSYEKLYQENGDLTAAEAHEKALIFVKNLNNIEVNKGLDVVTTEDGTVYTGSQLSKVAQEGEFFDYYAHLCSKLKYFRADSEYISGMSTVLV